MTGGRGDWKDIERFGVTRAEFEKRCTIDDQTRSELELGFKAAIRLCSQNPETPIYAQFVLGYKRALEEAGIDPYRVAEDLKELDRKIAILDEKERNFGR